MVLKQRFAEGRTNYKDIGEDFMYVQKHSGEFDKLLHQHIDTEPYRNACLGFITWGKDAEPIYEDFPQWIYSNDGQLFMTLV